MSSPKWKSASTGRHPFSVSSACHVHPDDRPRAAEPAARAASDLDTAFREHGRALLQFLRRKAGADEAPDLVQEVFVRAAGSVQRDSLINPGGFLRRIASNLLIDRSRKEERTRAGDLPFCEERDCASPAQQTWDIEAADLMGLYEAALGTMSPRSRDVFLMHRVDELSYREIHEKLGISVATVEYHMMKALAHIAREVGYER